MSDLEQLENLTRDIGSGVVVIKLPTIRDAENPPALNELQLAMAGLEGR